MVGVQFDRVFFVCLFDRFWQKSDPHLLSTCGTFPSTPSEQSLMPLLCQEWGVFVFSLLFFSSVFPLNTRTVQYSTWMAYRKAGFLFAACVCWFGLGRAEQGSTAASLGSAVSRNTCGVIGMVQKSRNAAGMGWAPRTCMGGGGVPGSAGGLHPVGLRLPPQAGASLAHQQAAALLTPGFPSPETSAHLLFSLVRAPLAAFPLCGISCCLHSCSF